MPVLSAIKIFKIFRIFFLKIFAFIFFFFKSFIVLSVYGVGIFSFLLLKIAVFFRVFLFFSAKIIIQATGHINQVFLNIRELLYGYRVFYLCIQALIELGHFSAIVLCHS
jgi:hypothetical protein